MDAILEKDDRLACFDDVDNLYNKLELTAQLNV